MPQFSPIWYQRAYHKSSLLDVSLATVSIVPTQFFYFFSTTNTSDPIEREASLRGQLIEKVVGRQRG
ncbi:hypothetical protein B9Z55_006504 [Caenorhabditis nigoni]|uniref:Uncharacterized protein n=1 Tax=Caenorhabditis nigoni TaxID=1611254 RepID=A0A2G5V5C7_9PELO|nr:hypothetical protein B9Z55_006504 [Caenorhabditis nigoni]